MDHIESQIIKDEVLIARFQAGDEKSFDELVHRYERKIRLLCMQYLFDPQEVEDSTQEIFIKVYRSLHAFEPQAQFLTWLYRIAINHCLNVLRSKRRRKWLQPFSQLSDDRTIRQLESQSSGHDPLQELERSERIQRVRSAISALPDDQRTAVILHRFEGLSYQQIAEVMGCSVSAVESRLHRAKFKLARLLENYFADHPNNLSPKSRKR